MQTTKWGPSAWDTFFIFSRNYPDKLNEKNKEHLLIKKSTKQFYASLIYILPCKYCRESFKGFFKTIPIDEYLGCKDDLTYWLYLVKDLVNKKLINQEQKLFQEKLSKLLLKTDDKKQIEKLKKEVFFTKPTPSFESVIEHYDKFRADCSPKTKSCRKKLIVL